MKSETLRFYKRTMMVAVPIMIQNGITNFVGMLDNIMVGQVGTDQMSAVAIVGQLLFVWYLMIFGALAGIGIFTAQFYGKGDHDGVRYTFRLQIFVGLILLAVGVVIFHFADTPLISLYLRGESGSGDAAATLAYGKEYLAAMLWGLLPFMVTQVYSSTVRSTGETFVPMIASVVAVGVNLCGNYILIFGRLGAPCLGVVGAAIATVISRFVESAILVIWTHRASERNRFIVGAFRSVYVPRALLINCIKKGMPLLINETLWSCGMATLNQTYSLRGLDVVAGLNISTTISNLFNIAFFAMGSAIAIIIGQELGRKHFATVRRDAERLSFFSVGICVLFGIGLFAISEAFPGIYKTSDEVRRIATGLIRICALCMPLYAYTNAAYFIIRSGGRTLLTMVFDSVMLWVLSVPLAYMMVHYTQFDILRIFFAVQLVDALKSVLGFIMVRKEIWIRDITEYEG